MIKLVYGLVGVFVASVTLASGCESVEVPHEGGSAGSSGNVEEKHSLPDQSATQAPGSPPKNSFTVTYIAPKPKIFENQ